MNSEAVPIIRLTLDSMKHGMIQYLGLRGSELGKTVEDRLDEVIKNFDFGKAVSTAASEAITEAINSYFECGNGKEMIQSAIQESFDRTMKIGESKDERKDR